MTLTYAHKVVAKVGDDYFAGVIEGGDVLLRGPKEAAWQSANDYFLSGQGTKPVDSFDKACTQAGRFGEEYVCSVRSLPLSSELITVELDVRRREVRCLNN